MRIMQAREPRLVDEDGASDLAQLVTRVGHRMGLSAEQLDELSRAAELHDVGKVGVPDAILEKPGELDADEWEFIRRHTVLGERILSAAPALRPVAAIVRASHERWDGTGYPDGLAGDAIPLGARVIAVCDAYEAMTTERSYRSAMSHSRARDELRGEAGRQFDPQVVSAFMAEIAERAVPAPAADDIEVPVQLLADRVRTLLGSAKLAPCRPSPAASAGGAEPTPTPAPAARPVPDARLPGALGRPDAAHAARRVELHDPRRGRRAARRWTWEEFNALPQRDDHGRHPLRDEVVEVRHDVDGRVGRHAAGGRRDRGRVRHAPGADGGYTTNLPLEDLTDGKAWVVDELRRRAAASPSTAARRGCWCRTSTSGRARSGCAGSTLTRRGRARLLGGATATTTTAIPGASSATGATERGRPARSPGAPRPSPRSSRDAHARRRSCSTSPDWPGHRAGQHVDVRLTAEDGYQAQR